MLYLCEQMQQDKVRLNIICLKDESTEYMENLPDPEILTLEMQKT